jgi:hypothetical protein
VPDSDPEAAEQAELAAALAASMEGQTAAAQQQQQQSVGQEQAAAGGRPADQIVSSNAYLLVYRRRGAELPELQLEAAQAAELAGARDRFAEEAAQAAAAYAEAKQQLLERQGQRQAEVRGIVEAAAKQEEGGWAGQCWAGGRLGRIC